MNYAIRSLEGKDLNYIHDSWRASYEGSGYSKTMPKWFYRVIQTAKITAMLNRSTVKVATLPDDTDLIVAWSVTEGDAIHYVYVREAFRAKGIAKWLLGDLSQYRYYTHKSRALKDVKLPRHFICAVDLDLSPELRKVINDESYARHLGKTRGVQTPASGGGQRGGEGTRQPACVVGHRIAG